MLGCIVLALGASAAGRSEPLPNVLAMGGMDPDASHHDHAHMQHENDARGAHARHRTQDRAEQDGGDQHAQHRQMMQQQGYVRSAHDYSLPDLQLLDSYGNATTLAKALDTDKPVLLNFIYTTCTTICPVLSATFYQVQQNLGQEAHQVRMISITIDPDQDTPRQLREYAERFRAGPQWQFITGTRQHIVAVQKAFDIYRGSKTNHEPITFLRASRATDWLRIEGIASAKEIIKEYHALAVMTE